MGVTLFAHIPLIHTIEGKKLSKRDKASTLDDYSKIGIMPDALRNYLLRLGWSYKDKEIFTLDESIKYFNLEGIGKSPSKLDMSRILSMNEHYIKNIDENDLFNQFIDYCQIYKNDIEKDKREKIKKSLIVLFSISTFPWTKSFNIVVPPILLLNLITGFTSLGASV